MKEEKIVAVFGVFDNFHEGHKFFLAQARKLGDKLVIVVAMDETVEKLKGKSPANNLYKRIDTLKKSNPEDQIIAGDLELGKWDVLKKIKPSIVALGYDQGQILKALAEAQKNFDFKFEIRKMDPYKPDIFHSSLL